MQNKFTLITCLLSITFPVLSFANKATLIESANKMVPESKLILQDGSELSLQTPKGTLVEVEFNNDGSIDEASGNSATHGDVFLPPGNLMNLNDAITALQKAGKSPTGDWTFEKSIIHGWVYEFEGSENGKMMEYLLDAKSGKLLKSRRDM